MLNVLTPPSPLASYGSVSSTEERSHHHYPSKTFTYTQASSSLGAWDSSNNPFRTKQIISPYQTPPQSDGYRKPMTTFNHDGPLMASQPISAPRATTFPHSQQQQPSLIHPPSHAQSHPPVQLPVPQPHVTYQPVSLAPPSVQAPKQEDQDGSNSENGQIASYMQIPQSINGSRGSLSEFAAQITCLFWFESISNLQRVEDAASTPPVPPTPLAADAKPTMGFRKWVTTMLSTTQVTRNVILLALMFIYRLKTQNPTVRGKSGSEYRLLTVALMLGNKFLDDNTYTNKTWADVSGISVAEIHVMEVEFLSNMRYNLFTSEEDWTAWQKKLGRFYDYFEKASKQPEFPSQPPPSAGILPAPHASTTSPPQMPYFSHHLSPSFSQQHPQVLRQPPHLPPPVPDPSQRTFDQDILARPRKRSLDETSPDSIAKRPRSHILTPNGNGLNTPGLSSSGSTPYGSEIQTPRLPLPKFTQNTSPVQHLPAPMYTAQLPPLQGRSMNMVYGQSPQGQPPTPQTTQQSYGPSPPRNGLPAPMYDTPQKPAGSQPLHVSSGSPSNLALTPTAHGHLSPSVFPINRHSPYRPVRTVNTLLVPPPSGSLHAPPIDFGVSNMHYQPLGRPPSEKRTGIVPYMHHERSPWAGKWSPYNHGGPSN